MGKRLVIKGADFSLNQLDKYFTTYKTGYSIAKDDSSESGVKELAEPQCGISVPISVLGETVYDIDYGISIPSSIFYENYDNYKIVELNANKEVNTVTKLYSTADVNFEGETFGEPIPVGKKCIWSVRTGSSTRSIKRIKTQPDTKYIVVTVGLDYQCVITGGGDTISYKK